MRPIVGTAFTPVIKYHKVAYKSSHGLTDEDRFNLRRALYDFRRARLLKRIVEARYA